MDDPREAQRERERRHYAPKRIGAVLIPTAMTQAQRAGLLKLRLIAEDDGKHAIGWAMGRLLDATRRLAGLGGTRGSLRARTENLATGAAVLAEKHDIF